MLNRFLKPLVTRYTRNPVHKLILKSVASNWKLLSIALACSLFAAFFEGGTFGILALALGVLSNGELPGLNGNLGFLQNQLNLNLESLSQAQLFVGLILLAVLLQTLRSGLTFIGSVASAYLGTNIQSYIQKQVFRRIMSFSFPCASRYKVGDLVDFVKTPSGSISQLVSQFNRQIVNALTILAYLWLLMLLSVPLTLAAFILFGSIVIFQKNIVTKVRKSSRRLSLATAELSKQMVENIQALRVIHTFHRQSVAIKDIEEVIEDNVNFACQIKLLTASIVPLNEVVTITAVGGFLILGFFTFGSQSSSILPQLLTFIVVLNRLSARFAALNNGSVVIANQLGIAARLGEILHTQDKEFTRVGGACFLGLDDSITFKNVSMRYAGTNALVVRNLSFSMPKGTVTALVGASGAGKSSIADLLLGLYEPTTGQICIDGVDLRDYSLESWRDQIGVVSQDTFLFNASISENIQFGRQEATKAEIIEAARLAQAHEFITDMPEGYETVIGERGYRLSGGQRQRLALARVILRQPEILILDEATSALDSESERLVQDALLQFQKERTVLVIAHRLSTVVNADQVLVLEKGSLVEQGSHNDLVNCNGKYQKYWEMQSLGV